MRELVAIQPKILPYVSIVWQVNNLCNYRCSYCSEHNWTGTHQNREFSQSIRTLENIFEHFEKRGYAAFKIFFSGGEPTLWPGLIEICAFARQRLGSCLKIAINTNLSRSMDWWRESYDYFDDVIASFHVEGAKQTEFINKFMFLQDKINYLVARMMMHDERFYEVLAFAEKLKAACYNYVIEYVPLFRELSHRTEPYQYSDKRKMEFFSSKSLEIRLDNPVKAKGNVNTSSIEIYNDGTRQSLNSNRLVSERQNFFRGWKCWLGNNLFINAYGQITAGTCGVSPVIGDINEGRIQFPDNMIICPKRQCHCGTDIYIDKVHPDWTEIF